MNNDIICNILDRCDIQSLLYGLGTTNKQFQKYAKSVLVRQTSLTIGGKRAQFSEQLIFKVGSNRNRILIVYDEENEDVFLNRGIFNVCATDAANEFKQIFPNVTELCIWETEYEISSIEAFILCFPELKSLKCACSSFLDLSKVLPKLPKLKHFTDLSYHRSLDHYHSSCPEVLERLDSYCFTMMDFPFRGERIILPKNSVQFLYLHNYENMPDEIHQEMTKKLKSVYIPYFCRRINYEQFTNLETILLGLHEKNESFFLKMLNMFSNLKNLKSLCLENFPILSEENLKLLNKNTFPISENITKVVIENKFNEQDENILKKIFPKAAIFYSES